VLRRRIMNYPEYSMSEPMSGSKRWPERMNDSNLGDCPGCKAGILHWRSCCPLQAHNAIFDFPYLLYECGGMYRIEERENGEMVWCGKCRAPKSQKLLEFASVSERED
jgi:hypothetical protein